MVLDLIALFFLCSVDSVLLLFFFFFSSRRRHTRSLCDWSSDVCSSDLRPGRSGRRRLPPRPGRAPGPGPPPGRGSPPPRERRRLRGGAPPEPGGRKEASPRPPAP